MNKFKKALASVGLALALTSGAALAGAPAANAYSDSSGHWEYQCYWDTRTWVVWRDYNWWEETFQWKRDGWTVAGYYNYVC
jgi:hypothetical protein